LAGGVFAVHAVGAWLDLFGGTLAFFIDFATSLVERSARFTIQLFGAVFDFSPACSPSRL
jgi:hypothetical protein